ncbi:DUF4382 domain-containing protein [Aliifodinibius sp. S!AR15-10]|uniref:DUF4382 domain-containing protein n=1 Tax=Aliifodinibius sp. S!AR15-10 TaxID=2950437 RepID=UPI0028608E2B|nr:DUF4382 domain-containing protein [Aliifodinibius sp. S!AR15-10]MDR8392024.1 DUF4382 domain-containing protein [Aliifodinibius sp. S!AR15-10]
MQNHDSRFRFLNKLQSLLFLGLITLFAASCEDVNFNGPKTGPGHIDFHLTDAPGDYEEVNIDVVGLQIHYTESKSDTVVADTTSSDTTNAGDGKWIELPVEPFKVNLLELAGDVDTLISSADLDPGTYKNLRLILGTDNDVVVDGTTYDLKVPSGQQTGYKIKFRKDLESGDNLDVTIDFDAEESVHQAGKSGKYILKPVLKAFEGRVGDEGDGDRDDEDDDDRDDD